jgi:hypothetical protein
MARVNDLFGRARYALDCQPNRCNAQLSLCGSFPILSPRTNKADVAVGISEAVAEKLDKEGVAWRVYGK